MDSSVNYFYFSFSPTLYCRLFAVLGWQLQLNLDQQKCHRVSPKKVMVNGMERSLEYMTLRKPCGIPNWALRVWLMYLLKLGMHLESKRYPLLIQSILKKFYRYPKVLRLKSLSDSASWAEDGKSLIFCWTSWTGDTVYHDDVKIGSVSQFWITPLPTVSKISREHIKCNNITVLIALVPLVSWLVLELNFLLL